MTDFFAGILDSIRDVGDDLEGFFKTSLGQAVVKGGKAALTKENKPMSNLDEGFIRGEVGYSPRKTKGVLESENFLATETAWLTRLRNFAKYNPEVKLGS